MNSKKVLALIFIASGLTATGFAQDTLETNMNLTLKQVIEMAREQSTSSLRAETNKERSYWEYRTFRSNYNPQLQLSGTLPNFNRSYTSVQQEDGSFRTRIVNQDQSSIQLDLTQSIGLTGGQIFLRSDLLRDQDFRRDNIEYNVSPVFIGFSQPLFTFNPLLWDKKIEPLRYEESQKNYVEELESISIYATQLFFDLMLAQVDYEMAQNNLANNDTIYKIAEGRYNLGSIAENELLQLELNLMNSRQSVAQAELDLEISTLRLKSYVGLTGNQRITMILPDEIPEFEVDENLALSEAHKNRSQAISFTRRRLEAERDLARAKGETGLGANLFGSFGLTNQAETLGSLYLDPQDQQTLRVGFEIPILDWGRTKSRVRMAEANKKLTEYSVSQDQVTFTEEVLTQVRLFNMLRDQIKVARVASDIGQRSYDISKNRFLIGKISITDLNDALEKKDSARRTYIQSLREFWQAYFELRMLTLYDFQYNQLLLQDLQGF